MEKHVTIVAALRIGFGALWILVAMILLVLVVGGGIISGDPQARAITGIVGPVIAFFLVLVNVPGIIGGIGLLKWKSWARILVLILAVLDLLNIPIGTIVGIYTIWVLMQDETAQLFASEPSS